jgi:hypothetical protein
MSSILDALKKVEQERTERESSGDEERCNLEEEVELFVAPVRRRGRLRDVFELTPGVLIASAFLLSTAIAIGSVTASIVIARGKPETPIVTASNSGSVPVPEAAVLPNTSAVFELPVPDAANAESAPAVLAASVREAASAAGSLPATPVPPSEPVSLRHEARSADGTRVASPPPAREAPIESPKPPKESYGDVDLNSLPVLTETERIRLGLPHIKINIVGLPTKNQPHPSALINMYRVYVGEEIPGTNATLVAVELRGIGIEVDGQAYRIVRRY